MATHTTSPHYCYTATKTLGIAFIEDHAFDERTVVICMISPNEIIIVAL